MKKITKAVIPAAGFGTRFLPFTKAVPKEMLPIIDTPAIEYNVREAINSGITDIVIIISPDKECIRTHFYHNEQFENFLIKRGKQHELDIITEMPRIANIKFVYQLEQLGLGHAVLCAKEFVGDDDFALLLGDDMYVGDNGPVLKDLITAYQEMECSILGTLEVPDEDVSRYGICDPVGDEVSGVVKLKGVIEKPKLEDAPSNLAIGGRYILTNKIFDYLVNQKSGSGGEIQLTDSILRLMDKEDVYSYRIKGRRYDIGSKVGFLKATIDFALNRDDLKDDVKSIINNVK
jgi:UTP--glucose-1-phosphate uridylyltransferase